MISLYSIPPFVTAALFALLGIYIFRRRLGSPGNFGYVIWCYLTAHWQTSWGINYSVQSSHLAATVVRIGYSGVLFLPITFYHFAVTFALEQNRSLRVIVAYLIGVVFLILTWTGDLFIAGTYHFSWGYYPRVGRIHPYYMVFLTFLCTDGLRILVQQLRQKGISQLRKTQLKWVTVACSCYILACVDFLGNYGFDLYPIGYLFTLISLFLIVHAITKHNLMDLTFVIRKTAIYSGVTGVLAVIYLFIATQFSKLIQGTIGHADFLSSALAAIVITMLFNPILRRIRGFVDERFFGNWLEDMSRGVVHEVKGPLSSILLPAELTLMDFKDVESGKSTFQQNLSTWKDRMESIIRKTLEASERIEALYAAAGAGDESHTAVEVCGVLKDVIAAAESLLIKTGAKCVVDVPSNPVFIHGSRQQLEIVFKNLLKNAAEATEGTPAVPIHIVVKDQNPWVTISVRDSGVGISEETQAHIFESNFTTKGSQGMGLGLYLSAKIIRAHGGSIEFTSHSNEGSEFMIRLPTYKRPILSGFSQ